jgi:uncharacterized protein (TIGR00251 family)
MPVTIDDVRIETDGDDAVLAVKAVPGASRDAIAGAVGDRLKVRVSAAPEGGRANEAICATVARTLGLKPRRVTVESGHASPEKRLRVQGMDADAVRRRLA